MSHQFLLVIVSDYFDCITISSRTQLHELIGDALLVGVRDFRARCLVVDIELASQPTLIDSGVHSFAQLLIF